MIPASLLLALLCAGPGWTELDRTPLAVVETRPGDAGVTWVRTTATLPFAPAQVKAVLLDLPSYGGWIRGLTTWRIVERAETQAWAHGKHVLPWPLQPRDYVVRYRWTDGADGTFTLSAASTAEKGPPPVQGVVRITSVHTTWTVTTTSDGQARVAYQLQSDPESVLPLFLQQSAWRTETLALVADLQAELGRRARSLPR